MRSQLIGVGLALAIAAQPQAATAQEGQDDTAAQRADARLGRLDRIRIDAPARGPAGEGLTAPRTPPFTFSLAVPFTYNSNVENAESDRKDAFHLTPSAVIDYRQQSGTVRVFARVGADLDEYTEHEENSASTLFGRIGLRVHDESLGWVRPYVHYTPVVLFGSIFDEEQLTLHTFTAGAGGNVPVGDATLTLDVNVARREATSPEAERTQVTGLFEFSGDIVPDRVAWSLGATVQGRFYTGGANDGREDFNVIATAGFAFPLGDRVSLDIGISLERNFSSRDGKDYTTFDAGPSISLKYAFG